MYFVNFTKLGLVKRVFQTVYSKLKENSNSFRENPLRAAYVLSAGQCFSLCWKCLSSTSFHEAMIIFASSTPRILLCNTYFDIIFINSVSYKFHTFTEEFPAGYELISSLLSLSESFYVMIFIGDSPFVNSFSSWCSFTTSDLSGFSWKAFFVYNISLVFF